MGNSKIYNTSRNFSTFHNRSLTTDYSGTANTSGFGGAKFNNSKNSSKFLNLRIGTDTFTWYQPTNMNSHTVKDLLTQADTIMKDRIKGIGADPTRQKSRKKELIEKARGICLQNYLISTIRDKRTEISNKISFVSESLRTNERRLDLDYKSFIDFMDKTKEKDKKEEDSLQQLKIIREKTEKNLEKEINSNKKLKIYLNLL